MSPRWTATVGRRAEGSSALHTPVPPPAEEFHKPQVAHHLQLLPDFVAQVPVVRMQLLQLRGKRVNVRKDKLYFVEPPHDVENIKRPAARVSSNPSVCYWQSLLVLVHFVSGSKTR